MARFAVACCLVLSFGLLGPAEVSGRQAEVKRLALVITNPSAGADAALSADAISKRLTALGFEVIPALNAGSFELVRATTRLEDRISGDTIVVIYYSGYAARANGEDWLIPVGASPAGPGDLENQALPLRRTMRALRDKGAVVAAIIDGCRQSRTLEALGGTCAGDPAGRERDIYQVSSSLRLVPGDLTSRLMGLLVEGRTIGQLFQDIQSNFGSSVLAETPATPGSRAALTISRPAPPAAAPVLVAKPATPPPAPAPVRAPTSAPSAPAPAPEMTLPEYLLDAIARADYGDRDGARSRAASVPSIYASQISEMSDRDRLVVNAQIAYINGDFAASARDFEASRVLEASGGAPRLPTGPEARRARLQGSAYVQLGRIREGIGLLEQSAGLFREAMAADEARSALLLGPVWTRLGEAYRLDGRLPDARRTLEDAIRAQSGPAKGGAFLQMARLAYDEGNWDAAEGFGRNAALDLGKASAKAGVADAYVIVGRAIYRKRREAEGEAWRYHDLALEFDPQAASAKAFSAELPARLVLPAFGSMRPTFRFNRTLESRALSCYPSAVERDAYLGEVKSEMDALYAYGIAINDYIARLWTLLSNYERHGYLEDYQDVLKGRGYNFRAAITQEEAGWKARREAVLARHAALSRWHGYAGAAAIPCTADGPAQLRVPGYEPNLPPRDEYVAAAPPIAAPPPPQAPLPRPVDPPPVATAAAPPQPTAIATMTATAPTPSPPASAPPPVPSAGLVWPAVDPGVAAKKPEPAPPVPKPTPAPPPAQAAATTTATVAVVTPPQPSTPLPVLTQRPAAAAGPPEPKPAPPPEPRPSPPAAVASPPPATLATASPKPAAVPAAPPPPSAPPSSPLPVLTERPKSPPPTVKPPEPKPASPVTTLAAAPPGPTTPAGPAVAPPPAVTAPPPAVAPASSTVAGAYVAPPQILFVSAPAALPAAPPPTPAVKGKPAPPRPTPAATARLALERGAILLAQGKYDLALREYAIAVENEPGNVEAQAGSLAARGLARLQGGQVSQAIEDLNASRAVRPIPEVLEALGRIYAANSNRGAAIDYYAEAIRLRPDYAQAHYGRAEALRERATPMRDEAELRAAEADYKAALSVRPDVPEALLGMGMARFALGDFSGAVEGADAALRSRPIFPEAKYVRARARIELDQHQEALKDLVDLPAGFAVYARACSAGLAYFYMADVALVAKDKPRAIELYGQAGDEFQKALSASTGDARAKLWLDYARQNALTGPLGDGRRFAQLAVIKARANRKGPSPTATLTYADACKRT